MLEISKIRIDGETQSRIALNEEVVAEYAQAMLEGVEFPAIIVFYDGSNYWLADGFHRYFAAKKAGKTSILESINTGTVDDAKLYSSGANSNHGLRRTNADKRHAVEMASRLRSEWSDRQIAKHCGVSVSLVGAVRRPEVAEKQNENRVASEIKKHIECSPTTPTQNTQQIEQAAAIDKPLPKKHEEPEPEQVDVEQSEIDEMQADLESYYKILESDDALKTLADENKQLKAENRVLRSRINGLMAEKDEAIKTAKKYQRLSDRLKKEQAHV